MTRKDYKLIAEAIKEAQKNDSESLLYALIQGLSWRLREDNPLFNESKFRTACGVNQ